MNEALGPSQDPAEQEEAQPESEIWKKPSIIIAKYLEARDGDMRQSKFMDWLQSEWGMVSDRAKKINPQLSFESPMPEFSQTRDKHFTDSKVSFRDDGTVKRVSLRQKPSVDEDVRLVMHSDERDPSKLLTLIIVDQVGVALPTDDISSWDEAHFKREELRIGFRGGKLFADYVVSQRTQGFFTDEDRRPPGSIFPDED